MNIRNRISISILSAVLISFFCLFLLDYFSSRTLILKDIKKTADGILNTYVAYLDGKLSNIEDIAKSLSISIEAMRPSENKDVEKLIRDLLATKKEAYGSTVAFQPGSFNATDEYFAPYYYKGPSGLVYKNLGRISYNYIDWDWYSIPLKTKHPRWSSPYMDEGGGDVIMLTYSHPFFKDTDVWGIATVDIALTELTDMLSEIERSHGGSVLLLDNNGIVLKSLRTNVEVNNKSIYSVIERSDMEKGELKRYKELMDDMLAGKNGFTKIMNPLDHKTSWIAYGPIITTKWSLAVIFSEEDLMSDAHRYILIKLLISIFGIVSLILIVFMISNRLAKPITKLAECAEQISSGNFSADCGLSNIRSSDEIGRLASSFRKMTNSLSQTFVQLKNEKELFKLAFAQMTDGLVITDNNWKIMLYNKTAENMLFLPTENTLITQMQEHYDNSISYDVISKFTEKRTSFKLSRKESTMAKELHLSCNAMNIYDSKKNITQRLIAFRDITETEKEEISKRSFLSLISHKLFTPLSVLQGKILLLKDGLLGEMSEKQKNNVDSMANQTTKLRSLIENLVNYVTIDESKLDENRDDIDLEVLINEIKKESLSWFPEKGSQINIEFHLKDKTFKFNKQYLHTIIGQLIDNGLKFNMSKPATVTVKCSTTDGSLEISVIDNGIGIPPEFIDRIFDKFYQIEKYYTGNVEGVGLGLAYIKNIVDHFNGRIEVRSKPGEGSTFTITLPIV